MARHPQNSIETDKKRISRVWGRRSMEMDIEGWIANPAVRELLDSAIGVAVIATVLLRRTAEFANGLADLAAAFWAEQWSGACGRFRGFPLGQLPLGDGLRTPLGAFGVGCDADWGSAIDSRGLCLFDWSCSTAHARETYSVIRGASLQPCTSQRLRPAPFLSLRRFLNLGTCRTSGRSFCRRRRLRTFTGMI